MGKCHVCVQKGVHAFRNPTESCWVSEVKRVLRESVVLFKDMWKKPASCFPLFLRTNKEEIGFSHVCNLYIHLQVSFFFRKEKPQDAKPVTS